MVQLSQSQPTGPSSATSSSMPAATDVAASSGTSEAPSPAVDVESAPSSSSKAAGQQDTLDVPTTSAPLRSWTSPIDRHPPPPRHPSSRRTSLPPPRRQLSIQQQLASPTTTRTPAREANTVTPPASRSTPPASTLEPVTESSKVASKMRPATSDGGAGKTSYRGWGIRGILNRRRNGGTGLDEDEPLPSEHPGAPLDLNTVHLEGQEDPRRWPDRTKWINTVVISLMGFASPMGSSIVVTTTVFIDKEFRLSSRTLSLLPVSFFVLGLGMGPFILAPASELRGRQPVYLWSSILFTLFNLGTATVRTNTGLDVLRFFAGAMGSAGPSLGAGSIGDMFVPSERGKAQSLYGLGPLLGPVCGTIAGGWIAQSLRSWRWTLWILTIFSGALCVVIALLLRETFSTVLLRQKRMRVARERLKRLERSHFADEPAIRDEAASLRTILGKRPAATDSLPRPSRTAWFLSKLKPSAEARTKIRLALTRPPRLLFTNPICAIFSVYMGFVYGLIFLFLTQHPLLFQRREDREDDDDRPRPPRPPPLPSYNWRPGPASLSYIGLGLGFLTAALINALLQDAIYRRLEASEGRIGWFLFLLPEEIEEKMRRRREDQQRRVDDEKRRQLSSFHGDAMEQLPPRSPFVTVSSDAPQRPWSRTSTASTDAQGRGQASPRDDSSDIDVESQRDAEGVMDGDQAAAEVLKPEGAESEETPAAATTTTVDQDGRATVEAEGDESGRRGVEAIQQPPLQASSQGPSSPPPPFAALPSTPSATHAGTSQKEGANPVLPHAVPMLGSASPNGVPTWVSSPIGPQPSMPLGSGSGGAMLTGPPSPVAGAQKKKKGRPEYRLPLCLLGMIILPCGLLLFGWAADSRTHWVVPLVGSYLVGMGAILPFQTILVYLVDAFFPYSASATACAVMVRSILAAVFPLFAQQLFVEMGYGLGCSLLAGISAIAIPVPPLLWRYGQFLRERYRFNG